MNEPSRIAGLRWIVLPASIAIASRVFAMVAMVLIAALRREPLDQFTTWDGEWYFRVATDGYHALPVEAGHFDFAFFPVWPLLLRLLTLDGALPLQLVAVVAANVLFVIGAVLTWRLLADRFDPSAATVAVALLGFAPPAYVFSMAYSESLFLVALAGTLVARAPWVAAALGFVAGATRLAGLALVPGAAAAIPKLIGGNRHRRVAVAGLGGAMIGFGLWFGFVAALTGRSLGFFDGSRSWIRFDLEDTQTHLVEGHPIEYLARFLFVALILVGSVLAVRRDRQLGIISLAIVGLAIASVASAPVQSIARYAMPAVPAYAALSQRLGRRGSLALVALFAIGEIWFASWTIGPGRVPP